MEATEQDNQIDIYARKPADHDDAVMLFIFFNMLLGAWRELWCMFGNM